MRKSMLYSEWLRNWLNIYKKPYIKSWRSIQNFIRLHIPEYIKKTRLEDLNAFVIQKSLNAIPYSRSRVEVYDIYHSSLTAAYKLGFMQNDIAYMLVKPKHERKIGSALSSSDLLMFLYLLNTKITNERLRLYFLFLLYTGCRRSEALSITWADIDFHEKCIHVRGTKNKSSNRVIPLFADLEKLLNKIPKKDGRLFTFRPDYVTKTFKKLCPKYKLHDLRHTFATRCMECHISMTVISAWLGHTRLDTTARIYSHLLPDFIKSEAQKFNLLIGD